MAVELVEVVVECDECGKDEMVEFTSLPSEGSLRAQLEQLGWEVTYYGRHRCDECVEKMAQEEEDESGEDDDDVTEEE